MKLPQGLESISEFPSSQTSPLDSTHSPLWMVSRRPALDRFVRYLDSARQDILGKVGPSLWHEQHPRDRQHRGNSRRAEYKLQFSRADLDLVRSDFLNMLIEGERRLHQLCEVIASLLIPVYQLQSVVIGEVESSCERLTITKDITQEELFQTTDLDLGNRQLARLLFFDGEFWSRAKLVSNVVEYLPLEVGQFDVHRIVSRVKAEEEIWNKVVDEIFGLDLILARDKQMVHLSRYVKDVFGIKIVVGSSEVIPSVQSFLSGVRVSDDILVKLGLHPEQSNQTLNWVETKNYLNEAGKLSGWSALKSVIVWADSTFELQIQSRRNFYAERERFTRESHDSFKLRRDNIREQVAEKIPLFRFYRDLLRWLFFIRNTDQKLICATTSAPSPNNLASAGAASSDPAPVVMPTFPGVSVEIVD